MNALAMIPRMALAASALLCLVFAVGCPDPSPVVIGVLVPDTGVAAPYAPAIRQGVELAAEEINAAGGINKRPIQLEYRDTATNVDTAKAAFEELATAGAPAIIGPATSHVALALAPDLEARQIVMISPSVSSPRLTQEGSPYFFRAYPSDIFEGPKMADFCRRNLWTKVAIVADDGPFGQGLADIFADKYEAGVREVVYRGEITEGMTAEQIAEVVQSIRKSRPEAVYLASTIQSLAPLLRELVKLDKVPALLGTSAITERLADEEFAGEAANGIVFPQFFVPSQVTGDGKAFVEAYRAKYQQDPNSFAANAYDSLNVIAAAGAGTPVLTGDAIWGELKRIDYTGITGEFGFDGNGNVIRSPKIYTLEGGEIVLYQEPGSGN